MFNLFGSREKQTWKLADQRLALAAWGTIDQLRQHVIAPEEWANNREKIVIVQSDQVPAYCKLRPGRQLYAPSETRKEGSKSVQSLLEKLGGMMSGGHVKSCSASADDDPDVIEPKCL